jgi:hypothetical protein
MARFGSDLRWVLLGIIAYREQGMVNAVRFVAASLGFKGNGTRTRFALSQAQINWTVPLLASVTLRVACCRACPSSHALAVLPLKDSLRCRSLLSRFGRIDWCRCGPLLTGQELYRRTNGDARTRSADV